MAEYNSLADIDALILSKTAKLKDLKKEIAELQSKRYDMLAKEGEANCIELIKMYVSKHGNILNREQHDELRRQLIATLYDNESCVSSYDRVLRLILERLNVAHTYLRSLDDDTTWPLLRLDIEHIGEALVNCNECRWLNMTEEEQQNTSIDHICTKYNTRVRHRSSMKRIQHDFIYPCAQCNWQKDFIKRS